MSQNRTRLDQELVDFVKSLSTYLYKRFRIVVVMSLVVSEVVSNLINSIRKVVVRYMFWGRGNWYRFVVVGVIGFAVFMLPFTLYRSPITQETYADEGYSLEVSENDLLVERGSSLTLIPQGRPRMDVITYKVQGGDTLASIATEFYPGENPSATELGRFVDAIKWANDLSDDIIKPNQSLKIPPGSGVMHKVVAGDTLAAIAKEYEASEQAIADVNWLDAPFELTAGQVLFVPDGTMPAPPEPEPVVAVTTTTTTRTTTSVGYTPPPSGVGRFASWPVSGGGYISQYPSAWHPAYDIASSGYPPIVAAASGTVSFSGYQSNGFAWCVEINHGNGYYTFYAHLNGSPYVGTGQYVNKGQTIGQMGSSGYSTGVHLHFEVRKGSGWSNRVWPTPFVTW